MTAQYLHCRYTSYGALLTIYYSQYIIHNKAIKIHYPANIYTCNHDFILTDIHVQSHMAHSWPPAAHLQKRFYSVLIDRL